MSGKLRVGVVGATGIVGTELLGQLEKRKFPTTEILAYSSGKTNASVRFRGRTLKTPAPDLRTLRSCALIFFVSSDEVSKKFAPGLAARGIWIIDDSAAFRLDPAVPLVIPEVNGDALKPSTRLIAGPNCTMTGLAVAGYPLHRAAEVTAVRVASYQAVSGAGKAALEEFFGQIRRLAPGLKKSAEGRAPLIPSQPHSALPRAIAMNVIPQVGRFDDAGCSGEETKVSAELRKIWSAPKLKVSVTAVRVPVVRGHSLSAWLTLKRPLSPRRAAALLSKAPGLVFSADGDYPTPLSAAGENPVFAGRLRGGTGPEELALWIVSDNLLKGAALNSIQIAETLLAKRWL